MLSQRKIAPLLFLLLFCLSRSASATYKLGALLGIGGTGITSDVDVNGTTMTVKRSDSPLVTSYYVEFDLSQSTNLAVVQTRGIALAPFSTGVEFTGVNWKKYYPNMVPSLEKHKNEAVNDPANVPVTSIMIKQFCPYIGPEIGVARGQISRQNDAVPEVSANSIYFGFRMGMDYQLAPGVISRTEMFTAMTPQTTGFVKNTLSAFGLMSGLTWIF